MDLVIIFTVGNNIYVYGEFINQLVVPTYLKRIPFSRLLDSIKKVDTGFQFFFEIILVIITKNVNK